MTQLLLIRHALPAREHAAPGGTADPELTELGLRQARAVAEFLADETIQAVVTSPMRRAWQTAEPLAGLLGLTVRTDADLAEYDAQQQYYIPVHELKEAEPELWRRMVRGELPDHVDLRAFRTRVTAALDRIVAAYPGRQSVAVFCHAGVVNAALSSYLGIERALPFTVDYTGISRVIAGRDGRRVINSVNETGHVRAILHPGTEVGLP